MLGLLRNGNHNIISSALRLNIEKQEKKQEKQECPYIYGHIHTKMLFLHSYWRLLLGKETADN